VDNLSLDYNSSFYFKKVTALLWTFVDLH